jgi:hypothetical protein
MVVAAVVSVALFSNQAVYVGPVPSAFPGVGDLTLAVGLVMAFLLYAVLRPRAGGNRPADTGIPRQRDVATADGRRPRTRRSIQPPCAVPSDVGRRSPGDDRTCSATGCE